MRASGAEENSTITRARPPSIGARNVSTFPLPKNATSGARDAAETNAGNSSRKRPSFRIRLYDGDARWWFHPPLDPPSPPPAHPNPPFVARLWNRRAPSRTIGGQLNEQGELA